jgi:hypothetical protein
MGDGMKAIIVEAEADYVRPPTETAERLAEANNRKYRHYGTKATRETYTERGIWALKPRRVIAWTTSKRRHALYLWVRDEHLE